MTNELPLSTQLSQALVAFTIEFDNEFEHRMPHRTTVAGRAAAPRGAPWLVSQVTWAERHAPGRRGGRGRSGVARSCPHDQGLAGGAPAVGLRRGDGAGAIDALRESLHAVADRVDARPPHYMPVVGYGLCAEAPPATAPPPAKTAPRLDLSALLSQVLLAFTLEFERESETSLGIAANTLRVLGEEGVPVGALPRLTGSRRRPSASRSDSSRSAATPTVLHRGGFHDGS